MTPTAVCTPTGYERKKRTRRREREDGKTRRVKGNNTCDNKNAQALDRGEPRREGPRTLSHNKQREQGAPPEDDTRNNANRIMSVQTTHTTSIIIIIITGITASEEVLCEAFFLLVSSVLLRRLVLPLFSFYRKEVRVN